ncbi:MAG TPA: dipeptidase [Chloroflexota bacterium]|nr:dipeptidase [Chloroflexota bacterium]
MADDPIAYAASNRERFLGELTKLLRIPSISTLSAHRPDMERAAGWLREKLTSIGVTAEIIGGNGHPLVYGEWLGAPGAPTILAYGHYDVQPVDPIELWHSPPFEPAARDGSIYARGASDDKGQLMTLILAAESIMRSRGSLPVNIKFLIEGEEEAGGAVVTAYVSSHAERLQADAAQVADTAMFAPGIPTLETGLRGNVYTEIYARGAAHDLHSGLYGGVAPNPLNALAHVIAGLKDLNGHITIPGLYDDVRMPDSAVLDSWRQLPYDPAMTEAEMGVTHLTGEQGFTPLERMWARPTLDVHGIQGGFTGEGAKTVIPAEASAKISMRLVPEQRWERIFELYRERVLQLAPPGIELEVRLIHGGNAVVVPAESRFVSAAQTALERTFGRPAVLTRSGGSIPIVGTLKEAVGLESVLMGWGLPDDNLHAPNEKLSLDNFYRGIDATIRFWQIVGGLAE